MECKRCGAWFFGTNAAETLCPRCERDLTRVRDRAKTNADRIRAMTDEELARFLASVENRRSAAGGGARWCGMAHALNWLQQPAEEVNT